MKGFTVVSLSPNKLLLKGLLAWYVLFSVWMAVSPVDRQNWVLANVLPFLFVGLLAATHRKYPLSNISYVLITLFLTLHTIGVHYTYAQVPFGYWLEAALELNRNHFDRIVHFCFGLLLTYPMGEAFVLLANVRGALVYYLSLITPVGLSGIWEIIESWVAQIVSPQLGDAYLGSQGDVWDAQKDIAAAFYGAVLCVLLMLAIRRWYQRSARLLIT
jgi:putative membrane protein